MRSPATLPVLPRASSGTSGFFFCGMTDEPVQKRSGKATKPKRGLAQRISSSEKRERWTMASAAQAQNSMAKSRSDTASREFALTASKPSSRATLAVDRKRSPGERGGAERKVVHAPPAVGEARAVAL